MTNDVRLVFVPMKGTNVNHDEMFRCYVENYLDGFSGGYAGYIVSQSTVNGAMRTGVYYQYLIKDCSYNELRYLIEYLERNPMHGYWIDLYSKVLPEMEFEVTRRAHDRPTLIRTI